MEGNTMSVEEKLNQANGAIKEGVGKVTDDKKTEIELKSHENIIFMAFLLPKITVIRSSKKITNT
jgi:hypothetical protein